MGARRTPCGWRLLFFLGLLAEVHGSSSPGVKAVADALPPTSRLFPAEVRTLRRIAANLGISHWNFSTNHCGSGGGLECDCSFNNSTLCHATEMYSLRS
uniref:Leucine-rich repeat-containing N-terminal plant-type domain-containing protein n=1 Tax=Aegilops tauschii subsp. strangulata TaxID=200361 RepID=A0A453KN22_AEGTS